jgi:hypothetical protein
MLGGWVVLVIVLAVWHQRRQKQIRDKYYGEMAQRMDK